MGLAQWFKSRLGGSGKRSHGPDQCCTVYTRGRRIGVVASRTSDTPCEPMVELPPGASSRDLGRAVLTCLAPQTGTPGREDPNALRQRLCKALDVSSWPSLTTRASRVNVRKHRHLVIVTPTRNDGHGGFQPLPEDAITCLPEAADIGNAVLTAVKMCAEAPR